MSTVTYDKAPTTRDAGKISSRRPAQPGFWARVIARLTEARQRQADEYLAHHSHLLRELDQDRPHL